MIKIAKYRKTDRLKDERERVQNCDNNMQVEYRAGWLKKLLRNQVIDYI